MVQRCSNNKITRDEHDYLRSLCWVTCHHWTMVTCSTWETPLRHVLPTNPWTSWVKNLNSINRLSKGVKSSKWHDIASNIECWSSIPGCGHLSTTCCPLTGIKVVFITRAWNQGEEWRFSKKKIKDPLIKRGSEFCSYFQGKQDPNLQLLVQLLSSGMAAWY